MTQKTPDVSERLSHAFAYWQCCALVYEAWLREDATRKKLSPLAEKTMDIGQRLVPTIMDNRISEISLDEWMPAPEYKEMDNTISTLGDEFAWFPLQLFQWNRNSRRVFHLPHTLVASLSAAEFGDVTWNDVMWPHDAFIVTLEKPFSINSLDGKTEYYDTIMANILPIGEGGRKTLCVRLFQAPKTSGKRYGLTRSEREKFVKEMKRRRWQKAIDICEDVRLGMQSDYPSVPGSCGCAIDSNLEGDAPVIIAFQDQLAMGSTINQSRLISHDNLRETQRGKLEISIVAMRIVVGWALYLETLSTDRIKTEKNQRKAKILSGGHPGSITNPEDIFHIVGRSELRSGGSNNQRRSVEEGGFIRPHWRRAHKRRPIDSAPDAPKTVKVPQKLIREDLVPLFGIIGGTKSVMFLED